MSEQIQPPKIKKLDETVVNRIAAGEVIQRPANALKELLENSLDAKSSSIQVTVKQGGLKLLQIQDNGTGIRKEDMDIVCERFTTSKLQQFEDLNSIATFGFRGEALASISHVAHLTIVTKTNSAPCAYRGCYIDGKLKEPAKACAGNQGTLIIAEDLFYNIPTRRKALKQPLEEYSKIADVVCRYAVHNPHVGFTLKKQNENLSDVRTNPNSTHIDAIRNIYGNNIARELLSVAGEDEKFKLKVSGWITNVNFSTKKMTFLLFINNRLVDSVGIKRMIEQVYSLYLPKGMFPFIYLSLCMDPKNVDVNVHPTKHEVHFLHEDSIIEKVQSMLDKTLSGSNASRVFYTQTKLPTFSTDAPDDKEKSNENSSSLSTSKDKNNVPAHKLVRTNASDQKLDRFLSSNESASNNVQNQSSNHVRRVIKLTSVKILKSEIHDKKSSNLCEVFRKFSFVGCATPEMTLIQYETKLYIVNVKYILKEFFYQLMVEDFGNMGVIRFENPLSIRDLISIVIDLNDAIDNESIRGEFSKLTNNQLDEPDNLVESMSNFIVSKAPLLADYFSLEIDEAGYICTLPLLIDDYIPCLEFLPHYLCKLITQVSWDSELECFKGFCQETADFYAMIPGAILPLNNKEEKKWFWLLEHKIFPVIKSSYYPCNELLDKACFLEVASLPDLYKVFERC